jgi:hypothetical protein
MKDGQPKQHRGRSYNKDGLLVSHQLWVVDTGKRVVRKKLLPYEVTMRLQ